MPTVAIPALLAMVAIQAAPPAAGPAPVTLSPEAADERCLAALAYLGSEAAQASRHGTMFFYGKLMGRDPGVDLGAGLRRAVADIAGNMQPEIVRCRQEVEAASHAMAAAGTAARGAVRVP